jgi:hypothetical protein
MRKGATAQSRLMMLGAKTDTISMAPSGTRSSSRRKHCGEGDEIEEPQQQSPTPHCGEGYKVKH